MSDSKLQLLPEPHTDFVLSMDAILWGAVRWVAVVGVIVGLFFLRRWLRRIERRGERADPPEGGREMDPKDG